MQYIENMDNWVVQLNNNNSGLLTSKEKRVLKQRIINAIKNNTDIFGL